MSDVPVLDIHPILTEPDVPAMSHMYDQFAVVPTQDELKSWDGMRTEEPTTGVKCINAVYAVSDIHSEFYKMVSDDKLYSLLPAVNAKYCVLAGDIGCVTKQPGVFRSTLKFFKARHKYVIMVPGNHEYYGSDYKFDSVNDTLSKICTEEGVYLLNRSTIELEGVLFIGATLWSAVDDRGFKGINDSYHVFANKVEYLEAFVQDYQFIKKELLATFDRNEGSVVVVTHHLPTAKLIHPRYKDSPINSAFYTNLTDVLPIHKVKYWFCGHTHEFSKTKILNTTFVCNPMGYPEEYRYTKTSIDTYEL